MILSGLQFESLVLNNRLSLLKLLEIPLEEIVNDNPYFQIATTRKKGCQIDFLIQTEYNCLYVCEMKFSKVPVGPQVIK